MAPLRPTVQSTGLVMEEGRKVMLEEVLDGTEEKSCASERADSKDLEA